MNYKAVSGYNITLDQALKQGGFYGPTEYGIVFLE